MVFSLLTLIIGYIILPILQRFQEREEYHEEEIQRGIKKNLEQIVKDEREIKAKVKIELEKKKKARRARLNDIENEGGTKEPVDGEEIDSSVDALVGCSANKLNNNH